jgi:ATP-dependent RNA helicase DeaD
MHRSSNLPQAFAELGLEIPVLRAVADMGFEKPSPIQEQIVPLILKGRDILGQARTGTGKTASFGMPTLQMIDPGGRLQMLVMTPTRELAAQIVGEFRRIAEYMDIHCVPVYGGTGMKQQLHQLGKKPHVIVGTPGRILDLLQRRVLGFESIRFVILDEVDRMLDIGFRDDIRRILGHIRHDHQTILVSATLDEEVKKLARQYMRDPVELNVSKDELTVEGVSQYYCTVDPWDKFQLLKLLIQEEKPKLAIVFCNTKHGARKLSKRLHAIGVEAKEIHGDLVQEKREKIMDRFRKHLIPVLVATDLAARGIDVHEISHIINYDLPNDIQVYVHRIGRTARMGSRGKAITFVTREQGQDLTQIELLINRQLEQLSVADFKPSPPPREGVEREPGTRPGYTIPESFLKPVAAAASQSAAPATAGPAPNLGGKFPVSRRRRR